MVAAHNRVLIAFLTTAAIWAVALRALGSFGPWGPIAGIAFLGVVGLGLSRAARI
jgi:hypothetical protein